jgi:CrcB protein
MVFGAFGAVARYGLDGWISDRASGNSFPWGIFVVNITGAFVVGVLYTVMTNRFAGDATVRIWFTTGFLGAYTTFSTLTLDSVRLFEDRAYGLAFANSFGSLAAGLCAAAVGITVGNLI